MATRSIGTRRFYKGESFEVNRNHERVGSPHDAIHLESYESYGNAVSTKEARAIAAALIAAADDFDAMVAEENDPRLKLIAQLNAAGENAFVAGDYGYVSFIKQTKGWQRILQNGLRDESGVEVIADFILGGNFKLVHTGNNPSL